MLLFLRVILAIFCVISGDFFCRFFACLSLIFVVYSFDIRLNYRLTLGGFGFVEYAHTACDFVAYLAFGKGFCLQYACGDRFSLGSAVRFDNDFLYAEEARAAVSVVVHFLFDFRKYGFEHKRAEFRAQSA